MSFHNSTFIRRDLPNKPLKSYTGYTQRGRAYVIDASKASIWCEVQVTGGEAGGDLKPGGYSGGTCPVEWRFGRTLSVTCRRASSSVRWSEL